MMNATGNARQDSTGSQKSVESLKQVPAVIEEGTRSNWNTSLSATSAQYAPVDDQLGVSFEQLTKTQSYYNYKTADYDFEGVLRRIFDEFPLPLHQLHRYFDDSEEWEQLTIDNDTKTKFHRAYYDSPHYEDLKQLYYRFVREVILPIFDEEDFVVQKDPTWRINLPNNTAIGWRPGYNDPVNRIGIHRDADYDHPSGEMNFMLGFTDFFGTNSCCYETEPDKGDFKPVEMKYGQFFRFYGNQLRHHNMKNQTGQSRVSIDFRVIPASRYDPNYEASSLHASRKFTVGGYYTRMQKSDGPNNWENESETEIDNCE
eukprot:gb/GECG01009501.1/.p1 GENE.gb/GECG01009501.1/~~gb/GECG01009501.1/.p1  ORF type:complete len:315 (+),score=40.94 gb/GECG01009501.1/:1-945(+)